MRAIEMYAHSLSNSLESGDLRDEDICMITDLNRSLMLRPQKS